LGAGIGTTHKREANEYKEERTGVTCEAAAMVAPMAIRRSASKLSRLFFEEEAL
jgi:hypothetical protein